MTAHVHRSTPARRRAREIAGIAAATAAIVLSASGPVHAASSSPDAAVAPATAAATKTKALPVPGNAEIFSWIRDLTAHGYRRTGTPAGRRAAEYMVRRFTQFGLRDAHIETVRSYAWEAKRWGLKVGATPVDAFPVAHSFRGPGKTAVGAFSTGAKGRTAPLVDVGSGTAADFAKADVRGKVVLFDMRFLALPLSIFQVASEFYWDPDLTMKPTDVLDQPYLSNFADFANRAVAAGAVGFVGVLADYFDSNRYFNEDYRRAQVTIPGMWITRAKGIAVREALKADPAASATITLEGRRRAVTGRTAIGFLPGRSRETVLVQSHHDSVWDGAVEDGSGSAEVLALAKHFGSRPASSRARTLMFTTFDTHFTGYQAHQAFLKRYIAKPRAGRKIVANVALEHIAKRATVAGSGKLAVSSMPEPRGVLQNTGPKVRALLKDAIVKNDLRRMAILPAAIFGGAGIPTDASFTYYSGVPVLSLISGPMYLYDRQDTLDKVVKTDLQPMARAFASVIEGLDDVPTGEIGDGVPIKQGTR